MKRLRKPKTVVRESVVGVGDRYNALAECIRGRNETMVYAREKKLKNFLPCSFMGSMKA